jgi:hypothetical protein
LRNPHFVLLILGTIPTIRFPVTAAYDAREEDTTVDAALSLGPLDWLWDGFNGTLMAMGAQVKALLG